MTKVIGAYKASTSSVTVQNSNRNGDSRFNRLRQAVQNSGGRDAISELSKVGKTTLTQYMKDGEWKLSVAEKLAQTCNVDLQWLLFGNASEAKNTSLEIKEENAPSSLKSKDEDRITVPLYNVEVSAGYGMTSSNIETYASVDLIKSSLPSHVVSRLSYLVGVTVRGDSMQTTLYDGDIIFFDKQDTDIIPGCVYVLRRDHDLMVKRLTWSVMGDLVVTSDNPRYASETISAEKARTLFEAGGAPVQVLGRVLWKVGTIGSL